ncbi:Glyoxylate/hydroxypyruvate reductase A like protein [Argiope bruennichi]|uniref:Glyoxylate/hydroxypyruvate reductase A like protein n=1 Tax=Argiope bruennichi TaxID=94029 RepID=A0A8T0FPX8_ARGBR|nr:Glyoxylate/hydroxypyruvate reductase A like protein [Argiope bruennichi]
MAACFSSGSVLACPRVYVISHIPNMAECLKACALPGIEIKSVDVSALSSINFPHRKMDYSFTVFQSLFNSLNFKTNFAKILKARGATVFGFARHSRSPNQFGEFDKISNKLEDILSDCDYLCNTLPSTPLTRGILSASVLRNCKKNPVFINVGRGDVIPEVELLQALRTGCLSGSVLDVFETEPLPKSSQLWHMPEVTITPHVAAISKPEHIAEEFFNVFLRYVEGHELKNVVRWSDGY